MPIAEGDWQKDAALEHARAQATGHSLITPRLTPPFTKEAPVHWPDRPPASHPGTHHEVGKSQERPCRRPLARHSGGIPRPDMWLDGRIRRAR